VVPRGRAIAQRIKGTPEKRLGIVKNISYLCIVIKVEANN
jgi:hypothetical protein